MLPPLVAFAGINISVERRVKLDFPTFRLRNTGVYSPQPVKAKNVTGRRWGNVFVFNGLNGKNRRIFKRKLRIKFSLPA
jgi:hypothetical protein